MSPKDESAGPLVIDALYDSGQIDQRMFSLELSPYAGNRTTIEWGGYDR